MKAEKDKNGNIIGYEIGDNISIHRHIRDPENWKVTIRPLQIYAETLCRKTCTEQETMDSLMLFLRRRLSRIESMLKEIYEFTNQKNKSI